MPTYEYSCPRCEEQRDIVKSVAELNRTEYCIECAAIMKRMVSVPLVHNDSYGKPIHSDALAIHPSQRVEHAQRYPDVRLDNENRPILDKFDKHEKYLEARGIYKPPGKQRRKLKQISTTGKKGNK